MTDQRPDVAVVGAGPAGAAIAARLAHLGLDVVILERAPTWRWRAGGVFASPAVLRELRGLGIDAATITRVARPIPAMRVEAPDGSAFRLTYGAEDGGPMAVGFDREGLDTALLALATRAGARVRRAADVRGIELQATADRARLSVRVRGRTETLDARLVVGADGPRSIVARAAGVLRDPEVRGRVGLTWHVADGAGDALHDARMVVLRGGAYCGLAPVPGGRVNIGIVLGGRRWLARLRRTGASATAAAVLQAVPPAPGEPQAWGTSRGIDGLAGASPLGGRVSRRGGPGWMLVGDAAGFLDPFTGEGLHRALVSARLAAAAIGDAPWTGRDGPTRYDQAMRARFRAKDLVSRLVLLALGQPVVFEHAARRLATRDEIRATMGLVMGDLVPASRALDPRFVAALLRP